MALALVAGIAVWGCGRERLLPRPDPLPEHASGGLTSREQTRLADIRRFLSPREQQVLERTLGDLVRDPRLPADEVEAALQRALSGFGSAAAFCDRLASELRPLALSGPPADAPAMVAFAVPIATAHERWLSPAGSRRYRDARALARAIRDGELEAGSFAPDTPLDAPGRAFFVTDAAVFDSPGPSAARRLCLSGPPAPSYVLALIASTALPAPLRVPTAADAVCRADFDLPPPDARAGTNCGGNPEFVSVSPTLGDVSEFRLSR